MSYHISIGKQSLKEISPFISSIGYSSLFILVDTNTRQFCLPLIQAENDLLKKAIIIEIPAGETSKNNEHFEYILSILLKKNADRQSLLINIGGGVICDIGGFSASVFKRGIRFIHVPTTLLSMVDASVGGKNGINFQDRKNILGTFAKPVAVFVYPHFLKTLSVKEIRSGFAEVFKHIILSDEKKFYSMLNDPEFAINGEKLHELIKESVLYKFRITEEDFLDSGSRQVLNFGHTFGHALESYSLRGVRPLRHGEAIAIGMAGELFLSHKLAGFPEKEMYSSIQFLRNLFKDIQVRCTPDELFAYLIADKKNLYEKIGFSLLKKPGYPAGLFFPSNEVILESMNFMIFEFSSASVQ